MIETELARALRHVQEGERLVEEQRARVRNLEETHQSADASLALRQHLERSQVFQRTQLAG
jgi:hypothetical protein